MFYPIFVRNTEKGAIIDSIGDSYLGDDLSEVTAPNGTVTVWPLGKDSELRRWQVSPSSARKLKDAGFLKLGKWNGENTAVQYLAESNRESILNGEIVVSGKDYDGSFIVDEGHIASFIPGTIWRIPSHDATRFGGQLLKNVIGEKRFDFPKSLYAVHDTIRFYVANKPNALIVDFFAGSGTTLHAVNLLNAEDGGHRRCIMVTNNEVSEAEAKDLSAKGFKPGDAQWEQYGIAQYVNWPRTVCSIEGHDINGEPLKGNYLGSDMPMADGFKANAAFFKLDFLDKTEVALDRQFRELLPLLWMKAGAVGSCPSLPETEIPKMLILPENKMAVLIDELYYADFLKEMDGCNDIDIVFIITDSENGYKDKASRLHVKHTYQLYRDYLENFTINYAK